MNALFFRPRPLRAWPIRAMATTGSNGLAGKGVINGQYTTYTTSRFAWAAEKWRILMPGIYRIQAIGAGGGGGGVVTFGVSKFGYGGEAGAFVDVLRTLRSSAEISVGNAINTPGANGIEPTSGTAGLGSVLSSSPSVSAPGGSRGFAVTDDQDSGASPSEFAGADSNGPATLINGQPGNVYGRGGDGGYHSAANQANSLAPQGGGPGHLVLMRVG